MTRDQIEAAYNVVDGIIRSPGKFEGEPVYVPYFWNAALEGGGGDEDDGELIIFNVTADDRETWPELAGVERIKLLETDVGFVVCTHE